MFRAVTLCVVVWCAWSGVRSTGQPAGDYRGGCTDSGCHDGYAKKRVVHSPVETADCDACHEAVEGEAHKFALTEEGGDLCLECHEFDDTKVTHQPVSEGECLACHDPHATDVPKLLTAENEVELCTDCHDELIEDFEYLHGPVAADSCTACHLPHGSNHPALLSAEGRDVCAECHDELFERVEDSAFAHEPVKDRCTDCHNPHGGAHRFFLADEPPELCLGCHDTIEELLDDATVTHDAVTADRACLNCHDPHAGEIEKLLLKESMALCLSCHDREQGSGDEKVLNIALHLKENPDHHGPIRDGDCTSCHNPHGGENFRMLNLAFPARFYVPFDEESYALCFDCHEVEMLEDEETDEATGFRNGERNLHFLHVNRAVKGRTCRACHDLHGSTRPKHIRDSVPFGKWRIPINFEQEGSGGSCQPGCHRKYRYDRDSAVANLPSP